MIHELDIVVLAEDLPEHGLLEGDVGTVVMVHKEGTGYEVEFVTFDGETVTVISLSPSQIRIIGTDEMPHVRKLEKTTVGQ